MAKLVPKLRFPEFANDVEWEEKRLGNIANITTGSSNREDSIQDKGQYTFFDRSEDIRTSHKFLFDDEAIIVAGEGSEFKPKYFNGKFDLHQRTYAILELQIIGKFLYYYVFNFRNYFIRYAVGSTVKSLRQPIFEQMPILLPTLPEQQKTADTLSSLDDLISAENDKLQALQIHKKGLMQQLFPKEGERVPKLRFPEFANDGEWVEKRLGDKNLFEILNNKRKPITSTNRKKGIYPYYGASGIVDYIDGFIFDETLVLIGEDGAKWGAFEESAFIAKGKYWVNNHAHVIRTKNINEIFLVNYLIMIDINPFITGFAPPKLTLDNLKKILIPLPKNTEEQKKIADTLSSLDDIIVAQKKKIETLKEHKKGLMQKMFVSDEER